MTITIAQFLAQLSAHYDPYLAYLEIGSWLWTHFCFSDGGAHYIATGEQPPRQPFGGRVRMQ